MDPSQQDALNAFLIRIDPSGATSGPLAGLRVAVKDNIAVKGLPFTAGLALFADRRADRNASCVTTLVEAGAQLVGMTRTDAAGFGVVTPEVRNPVWPDRIVGGSSGGSAAAVAAGLADIGLGTDTGGSARIPAACCRLFGFKPSHGSIRMDGVWPLAPSLDVVGWMTRDLDTLARVANALIAESRFEPIRSPTLRIGVDARSLVCSSAEIQHAIQSVLVVLSRAGVQIVPITLPSREVVSRAHAIVVLSEAREIYAGWTEQAALFPSSARRALAAAQTITSADVESARARVAQVRRTLEAIFSDVDAIATPTLPVEPPAVGTHRLTLNGVQESIVSVLVAETCIANIAGAPAVTIPIPSTAASLQLLAAKGCDQRLLSIAAEIEKLSRQALVPRQP